MSIYACLIISALTFLILSLISDIFDGVDQVLDIDFGDVEIGGLSIQFLPISVRSICLGLIIFCSVMIRQGNTILALALAYLGALVLHTLTVYLKKHQSLADSIESSVGLQGTLSVHISCDGTGSVVITQDGHSTISFPAKSEDSSEIARDSVVEIVRVDDGIAIVKRVNK